jgi:hypothetical protein
VLTRAMPTSRCYSRPIARASRPSFPLCCRNCVPTQSFSIAYPKLSSKLAGDLNRNVIAAAAPTHGLDTVSQIAIDDVWSALRVKRVP